MKKEVDIKEYNKKINKIIKKGKPVVKTLMDMLEYASTIKIKN